jgi:hypothetical protein
MGKLNTHFVVKIENSQPYFRGKQQEIESSQREKQVAPLVSPGHKRQQSISGQHQPYNTRQKKLIAGLAEDQPHPPHQGRN